MAPTSTVRIGQEPDPAKRLKQAWGAELRRIRELLELSLEDTAERMREIGQATDPSFTITAAAIGMWERGETAPKWHHQSIVAKALRVPRETIFREVA